MAQEIPFDEFLSITPGKYTLILRELSPFGAGERLIRVTVLGPAIQHGWSFNGSWFLYKPENIQVSPHYVLPVRIYRKRNPTSFWIGFIVKIKKGWTKPLVWRCCL